MKGYEKECAQVFIKQQEKLLGAVVVETEEEALEFLEDSFAAVLGSVKEIREYLDESGMDVEGMSDRDILEAAEVFPLPSGKYMVVEA